jgi:hypothetical protein
MFDVGARPDRRYLRIVRPKPVRQELTACDYLTALATALGNQVGLIEAGVIRIEDTRNSGV